MRNNVDDNFSSYNWHDCPLYAIRFNDNLELDLDYILEWELQRDDTYRFLVVPAELVFFDVKNLSISIEADFVNGFEIYKIIRSENLWTIQLQEGWIKFEASHFKQSHKKKPIWSDNQYLSESERR